MLKFSQYLYFATENYYFQGGISMIINSHIHVATHPKDYYFYPNFGYRQLLANAKRNHVAICLVCINPKLALLQCPKDCSFYCPIHPFGPNRNLQNCTSSCPYRSKHRMEVRDSGIFCKTCGNLLWDFSCMDAVRPFNIALIEQTKAIRSLVKPILYLSLSNKSIQKEIDFFESHYAGEFVGYKLHPWTDQRRVSDIQVHTKLPFLIHTGIRELESPAHALTFAQNHPENAIIIAHAAGLKEEFLQKISSIRNVFLDCCPSFFLAEHKQECLWNTSITRGQEIYETVLSYLPSQKILFGSDSPWGNTKREIATVNSLAISQKEKENIFFRNSMQIYKL